AGRGGAGAGARRAGGGRAGPGAGRGRPPRWTTWALLGRLGIRQDRGIDRRPRTEYAAPGVDPAPRSGAVVKSTWRCRGGPRPGGDSAAGVVSVVLVLVVLVVVFVVLVVEVVEIVEVVVLVVIVVVIVEDDQRRGDLVGVEEGVVVGVEGRGELLGGRIESGGVVTARGGSGLVVTFEGGDQRSKSGARIRVHAWTVHPPTAQWTVGRGFSWSGFRSRLRSRPPAGHRAQEDRLIRPRTALVAGVQHVSDPRRWRDLPVERGRRAEDYEFQILTVPRGTSIGQVRAELAEQAEYGRWEHARTRLYVGGGRKVRMRRRIIRVQSTL